MIDGRLIYGERFAVGSKPAVLTFDSLQVLAEGSSQPANQSESLVIRAQGKLMQAGSMNAVLVLPIASPDFTFQYSGSLSKMSLTSFNTFLEIAEHKRLKTGILHSLAFDIHVVAGDAKGQVRASYKDLKIVAIDGGSRSESGAVNTLVSFISNNIKLRTTNMPDQSGSMKIGEVKYKRKRDDAFLEAAWFSLRSGISDVVGF